MFMSIVEYFDVVLTTEDFVESVAKYLTLSNLGYCPPCHPKVIDCILKDSRRGRAFNFELTSWMQVSRALARELWANNQALNIYNALIEFTGKNKSAYMRLYHADHTNSLCHWTYN